MGGDRKLLIANEKEFELEEEKRLLAVTVTALESPAHVKDDFTF